MPTLPVPGFEMGSGFFGSADCPQFLALASSEGWVCDQWELDFLLSSFPQGCFVWRQQGVAVAFITAANYGDSGWIGNLIVTPRLRGEGIGRQLMHRSLQALEQAGVKTVWLTASALGAPLYRKLSFQVVDTICRWQGYGAVTLPAPQLPGQKVSSAVDVAGWGGDREPALAMLAGRGALFSEDDSFLVCHPCCPGVQLGPWGSRSPAIASKLLERALASPAESGPLLLDVPEGNRAAAALLGARGFSRNGSTLLMYRGQEPAYNPAMIYALASMGSFG